MERARKFTVIGGIAAVAVALVAMFSFNALSLATANPASPAYTKYADITKYDVISLGDGDLGNQVVSKLSEARSLQKTDRLPETADRNTIIIFTDAKYVTNPDPILRSQLNEIVQVKRAPVVMVSEDPREIKRFADTFGISASDDHVFMAYRIAPADAMCETDQGSEPCGGAPMVFRMNVNPDEKWESEHPTWAVELPDKMRDNLLGWLAAVN